MNFEKHILPQASQPEQTGGEFAYLGLNRIIHERARLGIMTALNNNRDGILFVDLKRLCTLTDGNLSRHLTFLQKAGLIEIWKSSVEKKSQTLCKLSAAGRQQLAEYLEHLKQVFKDNEQ